MSNKIKRKIHIGSNVYFWVANQKNLSSYPFELFHIRVHLARATKSLLYIDASSWYFELSPKSVKEAIEFALGAGWNPKVSGTTIYVSANESGYYVLPENKKYE